MRTFFALGRLGPDHFQLSSMRLALHQWRARWSPWRTEELPVTPIFPLNDYTPMTGLTLAGDLRVRYTGVLRFDYLLEYGRSRQGRPLTGIVRELGGQPQSLLADQRRYDELRDRIARLTHEWAARTQSTDERPGRDADSYEEIEALERELNSEAFAPLRETSERVAEQLAEQGVTWARLEPEGLLGEFQPLNQTATIYSGMIRILAGHPALRDLGPPGKIADALSTIAEYHEEAHGFLILGRDCDGTSWSSYAAVPYSRHEALATAYTHRMLTSQRDDPFLMEIWSVLKPMLPPEYLAADLVRTLPAEDLRHLLRASRSGTRSGLQAAFGQVVRMARSVSAALAVRLGPEEYEALCEHILRSCRSLQEAEDAVTQARYLMRFFTDLEGLYPEATRILKALFGPSWPGRRKTLRWAFFHATHGPHVGTRPLRLHLDWIPDRPGPASIAGQEDIPDIASIGFPGYSAVVQKLGYREDDPQIRMLRPRRSARGARRRP